ncbi:MAG TPA: PilZ domain-containing protein [Marinagarivorans sp.]
MSKHAFASVNVAPTATRSASQLSARHYDEKRNFIRMRINSEAIIIDAQGKESTGLCHNLSGGGALIELDKALPVNEQVEVIIHSHYGHAPVFSSTGAVIRNHPVANNERFLIAVQY